MTPPADGYARYDYWRPPGTTSLARGLRRLDHVADRVYASAYNPLHRTGTVAALCLLIALVTGVYLLFVYEIARPWESMQRIQADAVIGRPVRALHRYASDLAVVAVILHVVRLLVQGKTWGPRALAWITGVLLVGMMAVSAITGFVLVWDEFGQRLAVVGAKMLRLLPIFPEPPDRAFVGDAPVPAQFFFMNLFLHVAVPLGMVCFLWLHTMKLARAAWFPDRAIVWGTCVGLTLLSILWPAPLPPAADLLAIPGRVDTDWFYGFWVAAAEASPATALAVATVVTLVLLAVPWIVRPRVRARAGPASVDPETCEGCQQCFQDCPYDAIRMLPGLHPEQHPLRADVQPDLCVSCGLCAGSCASLAIGPPSRTARHQLATARAWLAGLDGAGRSTLVLACRNNAGVAARLASRVATDAATRVFEIDCAGTLHPGTVSYLAGHVAKTVVLGCPAHDCVHREGATLADARILGERKPAIPGRLARHAVHVAHHSIGEWPRILGVVGVSGPAPGAGRGPVVRYAVMVLATGGLLALLAFGSGAPQGAAADHAMLRLGWRLSGQVRERCRDLTAAELAQRPAHMRTPRECVREVLTYDLTVVVDGQVVARKRVKSPGLRADRPLSVEEDVPMSPGEHRIAVTFAPAEAGTDGLTLSFDRAVRFERGRVVLITSENDALATRDRLAMRAPPR